MRTKLPVKLAYWASVGLATVTISTSNQSASVGVEASVARIMMEPVNPV